MSTQNSPTPTRWVLVIEDDLEISGLLSEALAKGGFKVVQAAHVGEANSKIAQQRFDCILTDLYLGKGDGSQIISGLRLGRGENSKVPILLMSAHLEVETLKKLKPLVNGFLVKPFNMVTLLNRVHEMLGSPPDATMFSNAGKEAA
jgi:two-component system copper resistance phosphate regulon response regulator CusR